MGVWGVYLPRVQCVPRVAWVHEYHRHQRVLLQLHVADGVGGEDVLEADPPVGEASIQNYNRASIFSKWRKIQGAGAKSRLESRIKQFTPHCV